MLVVESLDVDINGTPILRNIGLTIDSGEIIGLIGRNGAGKTTFLRSVMGLIPVSAGSVVHGRDELTIFRDISVLTWALVICRKIGALCQK